MTHPSQRLRTLLGAWTLTGSVTDAKTWVRKLKACRMSSCVRGIGITKPATPASLIRTKHSIQVLNTNSVPRWKSDMRGSSNHAAVSEEARQTVILIQAPRRMRLALAGNKQPPDDVCESIAVTV